jgi:phospholipase C
MSTEAAAIMCRRLPAPFRWIVQWGEYGFDFTPFGPRVPVSPLIATGTVFRVAAGAMALDHTSILKTIETRWKLPPLIKRDAAASDLDGVLTLKKPRTDDPQHGVTVHAELVLELPVPDEQGAFATQCPS